MRKSSDYVKHKGQYMHLEDYHNMLLLYENFLEGAMGDLRTCARIADGEQESLIHDAIRILEDLTPLPEPEKEC